MSAILEMVKGWKFGVFDIDNNVWIEDCFDNPHGFVSQDAAQNYLDRFKLKGSYEVRPFPVGLYGGEA